ncbi:MAG: hypothetical protein ACYC92_15320, partial [Candidatus Acidiferrales bacterium]
VGPRRANARRCLWLLFVAQAQPVRLGFLLPFYSAALPAWQVSANHRLRRSCGGDLSVFLIATPNY